MNAVVQAWWLRPKERQWLFEQTAATIRYQQAQNAKARQSHRQRTIRALADLGYVLGRLRRCRWGPT
jgi:hypothetical protein